MHVDSCTTTGANGKTYTRHLLRETYREDGKVKHRTIANISHCSDEEIEAIRLALKHKSDLAALIKSAGDGSIKQGPSVGAVLVVREIAKEIGIVKALGSSRQGKLALWQVIARVIDQGSRLSAVRLAGEHACVRYPRPRPLRRRRSLPKPGLALRAAGGHRRSPLPRARRRRLQPLPLRRYEQLLRRHAQPARRLRLQP